MPLPGWLTAIPRVQDAHARLATTPRHSWLQDAVGPPRQTRSASSHTTHPARDGEIFAAASLRERPDSSLCTARAALRAAFAPPSAERSSSHAYEPRPRLLQKGPHALRLPVRAAFFFLAPHSPYTCPMNAALSPRCEELEGRSTAVTKRLRYREGWPISVGAGSPRRLVTWARVADRRSCRALETSSRPARAGAAAWRTARRRTLSARGIARWRDARARHNVGVGTDGPRAHRLTATKSAPRVAPQCHQRNASPSCPQASRGATSPGARPSLDTPSSR